jgi:TetR/AcrR family fatty acid metabolism transcriptional regulator
MTTSSKVRRERAVREAKSELIMDAALKVFADQGFHDTRLEDIATAAGFSKGSLYNYFADKEDIFLSLAVREHERLLEKLREVEVEHEVLESGLRKMLTIIFEHFGQHFSFFISTVNLRTASAAMIANLHKHHGQTFGRFRDLTMEMISRVSLLFSAARRRGELRSESPDETLARYMAHMVRGTFLEWKMAGVMGDSDVEVNRILDFVLRGIHA